MSLFAVGKIIGCFGVRGDVKVRPMTHSPRRLSSLRHVVIGASDEETREAIVDRVVLQERVALMRFQDIGNRNTAERLVGMYVFVHEEEVEQPQSGSHFTHDLIGCLVRTADGRDLGHVETVDKLPAQDVLEVRDGSKLTMIPAVKEFIQKVNLEDRIIVVGNVEGLVEGG